MNREEWLTNALPELKTMLVNAPDFNTPLISIGLPHARSLSGNKRAIGQCWSKDCTDTAQATIFISPVLNDPVEILATLLHELIHASAGNKCGHRGEFARIARSSGLVGKMTATQPGPELKERLHALSMKLGDLPHARLNIKAAESERKKQGTRQRLYECNGCGQKIRAASDTLSALHVGESGDLCGLFEIKEKSA